MIEKELVNELDNITVSYSDKAVNPELEHTSLEKVFNSIKTDKHLQKLIDNFRAESDEVKRKFLKKTTIPYFVLATFENNYRNSDNLISTQFMSIDFDDLNGKSEELDEKLRQDKNVFAFFKSPSNNRKVIYKLDRTISNGGRNLKRFLTR